MSFYASKHVGPAFAAVVTAIALAVVWKRWALARLPYPPGPKRYPIVGNLLDFPDSPIWEGYARMAEQYGE